MILIFEITESNLFSECMHQSLIDVQNLRDEQGRALTNEQAISSRNIDIFHTALMSELATLYSLFANKITWQLSGNDVLKFDVNCDRRGCEHDAFVGSIALTLKDWLKYKLLAWWNMSKNSALNAMYLSKADEVRSNLIHLVSNEVERPYRYW